MERPTKNQKNREKKINAEIERLLGIFSDLDENKLNALKPIINNAAFCTVSLEELEKELVVKGFSEEYQNGENQKGRKKTVEADLHLSYSKTLQADIKILVESVPPAMKKSKLEALRATDD